MLRKATPSHCLPGVRLYSASDSNLRCWLQFEIVTQFFIGYFDGNGAYVDDIFSVVARYGLSVSNFGFDSITSLPWSFLDYWAYQACTIRVYILGE